MLGGDKRRHRSPAAAICLRQMDGTTLTPESTGDQLADGGKPMAFERYGQFHPLGRERFLQ